VRKLRDAFGLEQMVLVGDRGMISSASIAELRAEDFGWITALKSGQIHTLIDDGQLQLGLFDQRNLFELSHPDFPGERLIACRNPELAKLRAHKRDALIAATTQELEKVRNMVARGKLKGSGEIGVRVGKGVNKYKVAKHFELTITDHSFKFCLRRKQMAAEAALDGIYVIRTGVPTRTMSSGNAVRNYKALSSVERAFRSLKTVDLKVRPIHHHLETRVRAHIFLCMLAYYVEWHMREAWRELMFADEEAAKATRDPVAPARRPAAAEEKARSKQLDDGAPVHSFHTLLEELSTIVRNSCRVPQTATTFPMLTIPNDLQLRARELIDKVTV
jgi:transposase